MNLKINKIDIDWTDIKNSCRTTVNKQDTDIVPTEAFKKKLLISEHSPIRQGRITWTFEGIKSWVATHFVRHHEGFEKWVSTQRSDRTGVDRDKSTQDTLVNMKCEANLQALINISRVRLCYQASEETREAWEDVKRCITTKVDSNIGDILVPNCVYRCGCPEFQMCKEKFWVRFMKFCNDNGYSLNSIQSRYDAYNEMLRLNSYYEEETISYVQADKEE